MVCSLYEFDSGLQLNIILRDRLHSRRRADILEHLVVLSAYRRWQMDTCHRGVQLLRQVARETAGQVDDDPFRLSGKPSRTIKPPSSSSTELV